MKSITNNSDHDGEFQSFNRCFQPLLVSPAVLSRMCLAIYLVCMEVYLVLNDISMWEC